MKVVIKLNLKSIACILICIFFSSSLMVARQPITSIINVIHSQLSYPANREAGLYNTFNEIISAGNSRGSFGINYNASAKENTLRVLQFSVPCSSVTIMPVSSFVKTRRYANLLWMIQEKDLSKQAFC